jgi:hypothetical protein
VLAKRSTIFRKITKASVIISLSYKSISTCSFLVEDACVGVFISLHLSGYDFMLSLFSSLCLAFASPNRTTAAIGCLTLIVGRVIICFD